MVEESGEKKVKVKREFPCPHCGFMITFEMGKFVLKPGTRAQTKEYVDIKKSDQSKLESEKEEE